MTPLDIPGLTGWLETDSDGNPENQRLNATGIADQWCIYREDAHRGIILHYDHLLTDAEHEQLDAWAETQRNPTDEATDAEAKEAVSDGPS